MPGHVPGVSNLSSTPRGRDLAQFIRAHFHLIFRGVLLRRASTWKGKDIARDFLKEIFTLWRFSVNPWGVCQPISWANRGL